MRHRLVGLPLSPRWACPFAPGQAPPGREFVHGPRKGGCPARPPRGGPSPAARRRHPTFTWSPVSRDSPGTLPGLPARGSNRPIARQPPRPLSFRELTAGHAANPTTARHSPRSQPGRLVRLAVGLHARIHCPAPPPLQLAPVCTSVPSVVPFCGSLPGRPARLGPGSCFRFLLCLLLADLSWLGPSHPIYAPVGRRTPGMSCSWCTAVRGGWACDGMSCGQFASSPGWVPVLCAPHGRSLGGPGAEAHIVVLSGRCPPLGPAPGAEV